MAGLPLSPVNSDSQGGGHDGVGTPVFEEVLYLALSLKKVPWKEAATGVVRWRIYQITGRITVVAAFRNDMPNG